MRSSIGRNKVVRQRMMEMYQRADTQHQMCTWSTYTRWSNSSADRELVHPCEVHEEEETGLMTVHGALFFCNSSGSE